MAVKERLSPEVFDIPVHKIRRGYYSAVYFWREKIILEAKKFTKEVLMQVFQKKDAVLCGIDEAIAILKLCSGSYKNSTHAYSVFDRFIELERAMRAYRIRCEYQHFEIALKEWMNYDAELHNEWQPAALAIGALYDGDQISPWETVMMIHGLPQEFAHLESVYLGVLARRTLVATNVRRVSEAANGKPVLFFADRFDHYSNQTGDGYAATIGGAKGVATDIMGEWWGVKGVGTMPHALIACFNGNTSRATLAFARQYPDVPCISLVDFHNDCERTAVEVADRMKAEGLKLYGVRLDTSETMVDESIIRNGQLGTEKPTGVTPTLVGNVRRALDQRGYDEVKIGVSGGFNHEKIVYFERMHTPVDFYASGSSLLKGENDFTADIVKVGQDRCAKKGRRFLMNGRLRTVVSII